MKIFLEILPLLSFFLTYKFRGLYEATIILCITSIIQFILNYIKYKYVTKNQIISLSLVLIFGLLSIFTKNPNFIKMKVTFVNLTFSIILIAGSIFKKPFLKNIFGDNIILSTENWLKLSTRLSILFMIIAFSNEIIWRNFPENIWVNFKVFCILPLTLLFIISQIPFIYKNNLNNETNLKNNPKEE